VAVDGLTCNDFPVSEASEQPGEAHTLLAIAATLAGAHDLTEALRQTCRHLARFTGAETISAHLLDPGRTALIPVAAYHVPKEALPVLAGELLPIDVQGFREGAMEDITDRRRAEAAERQAETLRYVAHLASAAAHEINNPLAVITGRLELVRRRLAGNNDALAKMDAALDAARRIAEIIAHMGRITRLEVYGQTPSVPPMLDIRGSGPSEPR